MHIDRKVAEFHKEAVIAINTLAIIGIIKWFFIPYCHFSVSVWQVEKRDREEGEKDEEIWRVKVIRPKEIEGVRRYSL